MNFSYKINKSKKIYLIKSDLLKKNISINNLKIDIFIHTSAVTKMKNNSDRKLFNTNIDLTKKALNLAKKLKSKKFFLLSSTSVYRYYDSLRFNERSKTFGDNPYTKSKLEIENICKNFCFKNNIKLSIFRVGNIFNGFEKIKWSRVNLSIMQHWLNSYKNKKQLITNSFETERDWTYLNDFCYAIHSIIKHKNNFKIINLVSPYIYKDKQIMTLISSKNIKIRSKNIFNGHNAAYSIYLNKIRFTNWTSPKSAISLIKKKYEKN